jgi:hypothetical protein
MEASRRHDHDAQEDAYHANRRETIRADLVTRLRKVCANFSEDDFQTLIEVMTEQKMRAERRTQ